MDFMQLAAERYSVRKYTNRAVEKDTLDKLLAAGNLAPTAKNIQPQRIYVLQSAEALEKLAKLSPCTFGANTVLLFTYNRDEEWKNPLEDGIRSGIEDVSIVATHIMLAAQELGLGTCWCNYFPNTEVERALGIPENERSVLFMTLGYPAPDEHPAPMHAKKKDINETVRYL